MNIPILYSNCIAVKGANSCIICDLQRNNYVKIPSDLCYILQYYRGLSISEIKKKYDNQFDDIIDEYFKILIENELVFLTSTPDLFPELDTQWFSPFKISNAIIDIQNKKDHLMISLDQLSELNCKFVQLRFFRKVNLDEIIYIFSYLDAIQANILGVDLHLNYDDNLKENFVLDFCKKNKRLSSIAIYDSPKKKNINLIDRTRYIIHTSKKLESEKSCGVIDKSTFAINIKMFTESQKYNSCLNRKVSIDVNGDIKNCPSMSTSFGNIKDTTLNEALNHRDFKKYWNITKDHIDVCKDCEFRYICTDCRAYKENPKDDYSKPLKCGYNPYTNVWNEWSTSPLKQKAITFYGNQNMLNKDG